MPLTVRCHHAPFETWITTDTYISLLATSTAFLTVTISHVVSDWLQVGNFDPHIAWILTRTEAAANLRARLPQLKDKLRERGERFRTQMTRMDLGRRVPWWRNPGVEEPGGGGCKWDDGWRERDGGCS